MFKYVGFFLSSFIAYVTAFTKLDQLDQYLLAILLLLYGVLDLLRDINKEKITQPVDDNCPHC